MTHRCGSLRKPLKSQRSLWSSSPTHLRVCALHVILVPVVQVDGGADRGIVPQIMEGIVNEFFVGAKGVGDVLAGRWSRVLTSSSLM